MFSHFTCNFIDVIKIAFKLPSDQISSKRSTHCTSAVSASRPLGSQKTGSIKKLTQTKAYCPFCVFSHSWIKVAFKKAASSLPQVSRLLSRATLHSFSNFSNKHMKIPKYFLYNATKFFRAKSTNSKEQH